MNERVSKKSQKGWALIALLTVLLGLPWLYFQLHSSEVSSTGAILGALQLRNKDIPWAEVEPGVFMMRRSDMVSFKSIKEPGASQPYRVMELPINAHLSDKGWELVGQMGAGYIYENKQKQDTTTVIYTSCGPHYGIASLYIELESGRETPRNRPFNLFSTI